MNCQPGDLAIIVRVKYKQNERYLGSVIECVEYFRDYEGDLVWRVDFNGSIRIVCDHCLKPLPKDRLSEDIFTTEPLPGEVTPEGVAA